MMCLTESGCICVDSNIDNGSSKKPSIYVDPLMQFWHKNRKLYWRFGSSATDQSFQMNFRELLRDAIEMWGGEQIIPIRFTERASPDGQVDFEVVCKKNLNSDDNKLANTFLPTDKKSYFEIYDRFLSQNNFTQLKVFAHELGHIFGLRHTLIRFNKGDEGQIEYGSTDSGSVMNSRRNNPVSDEDKQQLHALYKEIWETKDLKIGGIKVNLIYPYHNHFE